MTRLSLAMPVVTPRLKEMVKTKADTQSSMTQANMDALKNEQWRKIVDRTLSVWGADPSVISDDGIEPTTPEAIQVAIKMARDLDRQGWDAPSSVVPDANGGIVFKFRCDGGYETIHIWDDGTCDRNVFDGGRLTRHLIS